MKWVSRNGLHGSVERERMREMDKLIRIGNEWVR